MNDMRGGFRIGPFNFSVSATYAPNEVYGIGSKVGGNHTLFIEADNMKLKFIVDYVKYMVHDIFEAEHIPGFVIIRSCETESNYHLIDPTLRNETDTIVMKTLLNPTHDNKHLAMGLLLGKWVLRTTPKEDGIHPYIVGVLPLSKGGHLVHSELIEYLKCMNVRYDYRLMKQLGLVTLGKWLRSIHCHPVSSPLLFDRYTTLARSDKCG